MRVFLFGSFLVLAACGSDDGGGSDIVCGEGTTLVDGECVADGGTLECGAGTVEMNGECVPSGSSGATCGPGTVEMNGECIIDINAPDPVTNLAAAGNVNLTWTAPANNFGTLVLKLSQEGDLPVDYMSYDVGDILPNGSEVLYVGDAVAATDVLAIPGAQFYVAYGYNEAFDYSLPSNSTLARLDTPPQVGAITIDVGNATATVTTQPANITLTLSNVQFAAGEVTVDVSAMNNTNNAWLNTKLVFSSLSAGTLNETGVLEGNPFVSIGDQAGQAPGAMVDDTFSIVGLTGTEVITADVEIPKGVSAVTPGSYIDLHGGVAFDIDLSEIQGGNSGYEAFRGGALSPDSRYIYTAMRNYGDLIRIDTTDGSVRKTPIGLVGGVACFLQTGPDSALVVAPNTTRHLRQQSGGFTVHELTLSSGAVGRRLAAPVSDISTGFFIFSCKINGTLLAISDGRYVHQVDLTTMTVVDIDPGTMGIQSIDVGVFSRDLAWNNAGTEIYTWDRTSQQLRTTVLATGVTTSATMSNNVISVDEDNSGGMWVGLASRAQDVGTIVSWDGVLETVVPVFNGKVQNLTTEDGLTAWVWDREANVLNNVDLVTGAIVASAAAESSASQRRHMPSLIVLEQE